MNIQVGDYVAWCFKDRLTPDCTSVVFVDNQRLFKGYVTKIKTHDFFFFKRDYPLYKVDGVLVHRVKPIITVHYKEWRSPSGSVYEADSYIMYEHKPVVE